MRTVLVIALLALVAASPAAGPVVPLGAPQAAGQLRTPDVIFVPTQDAVAAAMLKLASVTKNDVVYDLGCGDGKLVIAAGKLGARAVGIDIDPERVKEATANVKAAGLSDRVRIIHGDIFDPATKISEASVVTLYLLQTLNEKLRPRLQAELKPGTRVVSNTFSMGDAWPAEKTEQVNGYNIYFWTIKGK
jgi:cyclopropane fatty-acyl-phospholipid synthase-like methyltransferase